MKRLLLMRHGKSDWNKPGQDDSQRPLAPRGHRAALRIAAWIGGPATQRAALERYAALPPSPLELRERLEQLRALEAGMRIDVACVDSLPLGVDTPADLARARELLAPSGTPGAASDNRT